MAREDPLRVNEHLILEEVGPILGNVRLLLVHLPHVAVERTALGEGLAALVAEQTAGRLDAQVNHPVVLVQCGGALELFTTRAAGDLLIHVDVHVHGLHVPLEVHLPEEGSPAEVTLVVLHLFVDSPHVLPKVGLLRVDLLADVALRRRVLDESQVGQLDVLGQVAEFLAAVRTQRSRRLFGAFTSFYFTRF